MNPCWGCDWGYLVGGGDELWRGLSSVVMNYGSQIHGFSL